MLTATTDVVLLIFAGWAAYSLRLDGMFIPNSRQLFLLLAAPLLALPILIHVGLYRSVIRYMGEYALWAIVKAMTLAAGLWTMLAFVTEMTAHAGMPRLVPVLFWGLGILLIGGVRFLARWLLWVRLRGREQGQQVLIYGAGEAGQQVAASLRQSKELFPAGFIEDDARLHGSEVNGLRVYPPDELPRLVEDFGIHDVIVTLPSASNARRREVVAFLERFPIRVRILPALADIASGRHLVSMVREVDIGDLLGRDPVAPNLDLMGQCITGRSVLVTGAGGSIGSELCRQITALSPSRLVLLENSEHALYQIDRAIRPMATCPVVACLGSACDGAVVTRLLQEHAVETVYHAAAYKHVPIVENNVLEGVRNNVLGTRTMARAAFEAGVETLVLISTDKAVRPSNVMGATKRWAELIIQDFARQALAQNRSQRFCSVRFGNVLGSSGSVIPLFKEQIAKGGPVTVTHSEVTRYFMSIHEAVELVIQAGSLACGGEVFLLEMGEQVRIIDLARTMIRLAGHTERNERTPDGDIDIAVTGLRPGEKLREELLIGQHNIQGTAHPKIMKSDEPFLDTDDLSWLLERLERAIRTADLDTVRTLLMDVALGGEAWNERRRSQLAVAHEVKAHWHGAARH
jgi:FlaA1/EpsC-like NDP-sugar epimerase